MVSFTIEVSLLCTLLMVYPNYVFIIVSKPLLSYKCDGYK